MKTPAKILAIACLTSLTAFNVFAASITSSGQLVGTPDVIDFSQFTGGNQYSGVNGPVQIGGLIGKDITASSVNGALYLYDGGWGLLNNGSWDSGMNGYLGVWPNNGPVEIDFNFAANVSGFGAFMNYITPFGNSSATLAAYDSGGFLLELFDVQANAPISTPGGVDAGAFRGIQRGQADIASIRITGQGIVLDNLAIVSSVPDSTSTISLLVFGVVGIGALRRRFVR